MMAHTSVVVLVIGMLLAVWCERSAAVMRAGAWRVAHATFYGDDSGEGTYGGACGYGNLQTSYGVQTAALSTVLYSSGSACGQCFQLRCHGSKWCYKGSPATTITATNLCPPNYAKPNNDGGWCNPPLRHFDMSKPAFKQIADWQAGIVPVLYRRVPCSVSGGIRFTFEGNAWWLLVYVTNVGGSGDVASIYVKGSYTSWMAMSHNWGASYQVFTRLQGQALSFKITTHTTHEALVLSNVAPSNWQVGNTYQARYNFH